MTLPAVHRAKVAKVLGNGAAKRSFCHSRKALRVQSSFKSLADLSFLLNALQFEREAGKISKALNSRMLSD